jgi:glycosyltransferase involved in cell wall biosynthesis
VRILVISNLYPPAIRGGYEVECADVVNHLRARGDEVTVLTSKLGRGGESDEQVLRRLPLLQQSPLGSLRAPLASISAARTTRKLIDSFRPELVFAYNCAQIPHATIYAALESGVPTAFRICEHWFGRLFTGDQFARHLFPGDRGLRRAWAVLVRMANRAPALRLETEARFPVAVSWISEFMHRSTPTPRDVEIELERTIVPGPPNPERFLSVERKPAQGKKLICFVGRLSPEKGPDVAIRALARLRSVHAADAELVFAGRGSRFEQKSLIGLAASLGIDEHCQFAGQLEPAAIADLLSRGDVLVVPSLWEEPLGFVALEGALARIPVVASRCGGIPEILSDPEGVLLFPPSDADACAEAIAAVLERPAEAAARVEWAFARVRALTRDVFLRETDVFLADTLAALAR